MEATNTDFHAYQFKPVLKMLNAPTGNLLIADEVGLGKTIEAGLIWTELKARFGYRRLLVLCPASLREKWRSELATKFDLEARIVFAPDLLSLVEDQTRTTRGFVAIGSIQGLRPPRGWDESDSDAYSRPASRLARLLEAQAEQEPLFDLIVVDEAHHLRNPETRHHLLGRLLRPLANHRLFLSATPVHLRSRDLFSLLSLLDPDTFTHELVLAEMIEANRPLIAARDAVLGGASRQDLLAALDAAAAHPLLHNSEQIAALRQEASEQDKPLSGAERATLAERLESANLLANIINRTRRRDVKEFRVVRQVTPYFADMTPLERSVYERVAKEVDAYALEKDAVPGFLLAMPARQLASSIPAAVAHWRSQDADLASEDEENGTNGDSDARDARPLVDRLVRLCRDLPEEAELEREDSKFDEFVRVIRNYLDTRPNEKLVVFSTFRATLHYLARRLSAAGLDAAAIHGGISDRESVLDHFRESRNVRVLLSSEVGSEGIDLQFCRAVVNYDLPWNPMRIEQRIGRIDRLGQEASSIAVLNLLHRDTIDERIYRRLYERLKLIEQALGDFEEVLGEEIQKLTIDLLTRALTKEQESDRIDQTRQAIENVRQQTAALEASAASLIALGDEILRSINAAHDNHRFIGAQDLASYLSDALATLFPGCTLHQRDEIDLYDIQLTQGARLAYADWIEAHHYPSGDRLQRDIGPVVCRLGRPDPERRRKPIETV
ncbi:MAG: helicase-related protein, partial [Acetobacteraceae bacterium]